MRSARQLQIDCSHHLIVSPIAGLPADRFGFGQAHTVATSILATAPLILPLSPFRRARVT